MIKLFLTSALFILTSNQAISAEVLRLSEPVQQNETSETFGTPITEASLAKLESTNLSALLNQANARSHQTTVLQTRVAKVCQKKGCFFIAQEGQHRIRVSFKDYGFFVPTDIGGKQVTLVGELVTREVSQELAEHFSKDLNFSKGTGSQNLEDETSLPSGTVYEFVASSVRIPRE